MKQMTALAMVSASMLGPVAIHAGPAQKTVQAALSTPADRKSAPSFKLRDAAGKTVTLSDFKGRVAVVNLWATECGGCKAELPAFVELHRCYKDQGLAIVGVSLDVMYEDLKTPAEGWARVKPFAAAHELRYTIVLDDGSVEKAYNVTAMPATYLIDRRGRIAATYAGIVDPADLKANVSTLLAEGN
jgi:peroxiredoxin